MCERVKSKGNKIMKNISSKYKSNEQNCMHARGKWDAYTDEKSRVRKKGMRIIAGWIIRIYCSAFNTQVVENNAWIFPEKKENGIGKTERKVKKKFPAPFFLFSQGEIKDLSQSWMCDRISLLLRRKTFLTISNVKSRRTTSHIIYIREGNSDHDGIRCACMCVEGSKAYTSRRRVHKQMLRAAAVVSFSFVPFSHTLSFSLRAQAPAEWK